MVPLHFCGLRLKSFGPQCRESSAMTPPPSCSDRRPLTSPTPIWVNSAVRVDAWRSALAASISLSVRRRAGTMWRPNSRPDGGRTWSRCG